MNAIALNALVIYVALALLSSLFSLIRRSFG